MKRTYLLFFLLLSFLTAGAQSGSGTYAANGYTWKFTLSGGKASITGIVEPESQQTGALSIPGTVVYNGTSYPVTQIGPGGSSGVINSRYLTSIVIPENVTTLAWNAFHNAQGVRKITLPSTLKTIGDASLSQLYSVQSLTLPSGLQSIGNQGIRVLLGVKELVIPASVSNIGMYGIAHMYNMESVVFEARSTAPTLSSSGIFYNVNRLKYVDMTGLPASTFTDSISRSSGIFNGLYPYTIVYLPSGTESLIKSGEVNFVTGNTCKHFAVYDDDARYRGFTDFSGYIVSQKAMYEGCEYPIQHAFTAEKASYDRTFSGTTCKTLYLPYPATLPASMTAYELKEKRTRGNGDLVYAFTAISGNQLAANHPYLIRISDGTSTSVTFDSDTNVSVPVTPSINSTAVGATNDANWKFMGTTEAITDTLAQSAGAYNLSSNVWYPVQTGGTGFIHPCRAFIVGSSASFAKSFLMVLDDATTTGIEEMEQEVETGSGEIFTLDGRSAGYDLNVLKRGEIYIKNGKKFYKF